MEEDDEEEKEEEEETRENGVIRGDTMRDTREEERNFGRRDKDGGITADKAAEDGGVRTESTADSPNRPLQPTSLISG